MLQETIADDNDEPEEQQEQGSVTEGQGDVQGGAQSDSQNEQGNEQGSWGVFCLLLMRSFPYVLPTHCGIIYNSFRKV